MIVNNLEEIMLGSIFMFAFYMISIIVTMSINYKDDSLPKGRFRILLGGAFVGLICNVCDYLLYISNIDSDFFWLIKVFFIAGSLWKLYELNRSGDPSWETMDTYQQEDGCYSTIGFSFLIILAYTLPVALSILIVIICSIINTINNIDKYKWQRVIPISIIGSSEIVIASFLVKKAYGLPILWAIFVIAFIGALFNILFNALNDLIFDMFFGDKYMNE